MPEPIAPPRPRHLGTDAAGTGGAPPRLLVNCSNLHVGGAVAVATSFVDCLSRMPQARAGTSLLLSSIVHANLRAMGTDLDGFSRVDVVDYPGVQSLWRGLGRRLSGYDVVFTVFGPAYTLHRPARHICGFAQPAIIFPDPPVEQLMSPPRRALERLKYRIHEMFFARADELVVELEHVRDALRRKRLFRRQPIHVVYNSVDAIFREPARWRPVELPATPGSLRLGVVSRNYVHKNLACLPAVRQRLADTHGLAVEFFVTFTDAEWQTCTPEFRASIRNVGALVLPQCPNFYKALDGVVFPSLLECFSAVPLETMMMRKPLFASDRAFIRDCCHEHAHYFDPLDAASIASTIATYFGTRSEQDRSDALDRALAYVRGMPTAADRARRYVEIACAQASPHGR